MIKVCPVTDQLVNEKVTRVVAFFTFAISCLFIFLDQFVLFGLLTVDFFIRGFWKGENSVIMAASVWISEKLKFAPKPINAGPKIFAARIGSVLSAGAIIALVLDFINVSMVLAGILAFFAFLEFAFGLCVACKLYPFVRKLGI